MRITRLFTNGIMNKDVDERLLPQGQYRHGENIRVTNSDGENKGVVEDLKGTTLLYSIGDILTLKDGDAVVVGKVEDKENQKVYSLVSTSSGDYILEYDRKTEKTKKVVYSGSLNLDPDFSITQIKVLQDKTLGTKFITWEDANSAMKMTDLSQTETWNDDGFEKGTSANAITVGVGKDTSNQKIYYLVFTDGDDYLLEYDKVNNITLRVLQSATKLGLDPNYPINEIRILHDSFSGNRFAIWTDGKTEPKCVNIERAKTWNIDGFNLEDILLIKQPPQKPPTTKLVMSDNIKENNLEEKFYSFSYRYKYIDGEYSALAPFSPYMFEPKPFDLDWASKENNGMTNNFNAVQILFQTGGKYVKSIDLVFKESGSNTIYKIQTIKKGEAEIAPNQPTDDIYNRLAVFQFSNDKIYSVLPEKELYRLYDSVPLKATDVDILDGRLVFSDITEGYNMLDKDDNEVNPDYSLELVTTDVQPTEVPTTLGAVNIIADFTGIPLNKGEKIYFDIRLKTNINGDGSYSGKFEFTMEKDYTDVIELINDESFSSFVEDIWTQNFTANYVFEVAPNMTVTSVLGFVIHPMTTATSLVITAPQLVLWDDVNNVVQFSPFVYDYNSAVAVISTDSRSSLKSNSSYELGIVYKEKYNRGTPVLVCQKNTLFIPIENSVTRNRLQVTVKNKPPKWADKYQFVLKQNRFGWETVYVSTYYWDGSFVWCMIDGANKNKVKDGDMLIIKSDYDGAMSNAVRTKVLEVKDQPKGFLRVADEDSIDEVMLYGDAGLYMKIKPIGFRLSSNDSKISVYYGKRTWEGQPDSNGYAAITAPDFPIPDAGSSPTVYEITEGSRIRIYIHFWRHGSKAYILEYDKTFTATSNYLTYKDWFLAEAKQNIEDWGTLVEDIQTGTPTGYDWVYGDGFGFINDDKNFYILPKYRSASGSPTHYEVRWEVFNADSNPLIFETTSKEVEDDIYYETSQVFDIVNGYHKGNVQDQTSGHDAVCLLDAFNCFVQGNGVESNKVRDGFNTPELYIDLRPSTTLDEEYRERNLFNSFTWGGNYEAQTQYNGLNEFNRFTANIKQLDTKYGRLTRILAREGNLMTMQEDKIGYMMYRKRALFNQDGSANLGSTDVDFGDFIPYVGEYGCQHPLSVATEKNRVYFVDVKRSQPCRLSENGINEITGYYYETENVRRTSMESYFKELFKNKRNIRVRGVHDPEYGEYIITAETIMLVRGTAGKPAPLEPMKTTLAFKESTGGWTSFYTFYPERMIGMNDKLYAFSKGDLYLMYDDTVNRNTFFGVKFPSKIAGIFNEAPSDVKVFHAFNIEGNRALNFKFETNLVESSIREDEFREVEKEWYSEFKKTEVEETHSQATQGLGVIDTVGVNRLNFTTAVNPNISIGDSVYVDDLNTMLGTVNQIGSNFITYTALTGSVPSQHIGKFAFAQKSARINGSEIRGYYLRFDAETNKEERLELYSLNAEVAQSKP